MVFFGIFNLFEILQLSYIPWRKAFKYNKSKAGGNVGEHVGQKHNPTEWSAEKLCADLDGIVAEAISLSKVIFAV